MAIKKTDSGWLVDIQPGGRGSRRYRKCFGTKGEALAFEAWITTKVIQQPDWVPPKKDNRRLRELVELWYKHHGQQLKAGRDTYNRLIALSEALGNPVAETFNATMFAVYRTKRISEGITPNCVNREHAYLRAVFNELRRVGEWVRENPLKDLRQFKIEERELSYLTIEEIQLLLKVLKTRSSSAYLIAKICLSTGARWSEAEALKTSQLKNNQITFYRTKSGKNRTVPVTEELAREIESVKPPHFSTRYFKNAYEDFRRAIESSGIKLLPGQLTHVLRHSFASHFMMNGGNILTLQKILGHSSITMTIKYAHLAPEHLQEAKTLNPLSKLD